MTYKPAVTPHEFNKRFNACYEPTNWHRLRLPHTCRPACNTAKAVKRMPKRIEPLEEHGDEREDF